jgi:hypothetical protein
MRGGAARRGAAGKLKTHEIAPSRVKTVALR